MTAGRGEYRTCPRCSETTLAHLQRHHSKKGTELRLHRHVYPKNPDASSIGELIAGILTLLLLFGAMFWALPVIAEYWR